MTAARPAAALLLAGLVSGCATLPTYPPETLEYAFLEAEVYRAWAFSNSETPFANGAMDIVVTEGDHLRTYRLLPCRGGAAICAGTLNGPAGTLTRTPDYWIVEGLFDGRTIYLSPGGDGAMWYGPGRAVPLAWNSIG